MMRPLAPRFAGLSPRSPASSQRARSSSRKRDTSCELLLRRAVWGLGLRYRVDAKDLPGRPDLVFTSARVAIFCDGDFWHGRNLDERVARLSGGHNAPYWAAKLQANVARDARNTHALTSGGWTVLRFWESDIRRQPNVIASVIEKVVRESVQATRRKSAPLPPPTPR